jgi:hypothetical protein
MSIIETVWPDRNNTVILRLRDNSVTGFMHNAANSEDWTKVELVEDDEIIATSEGTDYFDWSDGDGKLIISLGEADLEARSYRCEVVVYDSAHPLGVVWGEVTFNIKRTKAQEVTP